jgi:hypothetical protein
MLLHVPPLDHRDDPRARRRPADPARMQRDRPPGRPDDAAVPVFDTTRLHAEKAVELALEPLRGL